MGNLRKVCHLTFSAVISTSLLGKGLFSEKSLKHLKYLKYHKDVRKARFEAVRTVSDDEHFIRRM